MFNPIAKSVQRVSLPVRRVLIVDPNEAAARAMGELLRDICAPQVWSSPTSAKALKLAGKVDPDLVICEMSAERVDGPVFTRTLRRSDLACRKAPVVLASASPSPAAILAARDAGAHELLRKPFTAKDLSRRIQAATLLNRTWIEAVDYVGPDRRRFNLSEFPGELKRLADGEAAPHAVRVGEALKILRSAVEAMERDPAQALRSLSVQADELQETATATADHRLAAAAYEMQTYLGEVRSGAADFTRATIAHRAAALLAFAAREGRSARAA